MAMNREQRRQMSKAMGLGPGETLNLVGIIVQFDNGKNMSLDLTMVQLIDRETKEPLFREVLEPIGNHVANTIFDAPEDADEPAAAPATSTEKYVVQFDTPEGRMEFVKDGEWSGVRPVKS